MRPTPRRTNGKRVLLGRISDVGWKASDGGKETKPLISDHVLRRVDGNICPDSDWKAPMVKQGEPACGSGAIRNKNPKGLKCVNPQGGVPWAPPVVPPVYPGDTWHRSVPMLVFV